MITSEAGQMLVSGGLTTDVCVHGLEEGGVLGADWHHGVGYTGDRLVEAVGGYVVVNKYTGMEVWKLGAEKG